MPKYKTHDRITVLSSLICSGCLYLLTQSTGLTITTGVSIIAGGFLLNGDLDWDSSDLIVDDDIEPKEEKELRKKYKSSRIYNRWGVIKYIWWPYKKIFSHRSFFTHGLLIGETIRYLYLTLMSVVLLLLGNIGIASINSFYKDKSIKILQVIEMTFYQITKIINLARGNLRIILIILIGLTIGSLLHSIADILESKKERKNTPNL